MNKHKLLSINIIVLLLEMILKHFSVCILLLKSIVILIYYGISGKI